MISLNKGKEHKTLNFQFSEPPRSKPFFEAIASLNSLFQSIDAFLDAVAFSSPSEAAPLVSDLIVASGEIAEVGLDSASCIRFPHKTEGIWEILGEKI